MDDVAEAQNAGAITKLFLIIEASRESELKKAQLHKLHALQNITSLAHSFVSRQNRPKKLVLSGLFKRLYLKGLKIIFEDSNKYDKSAVKIVVR